MPTVSNCGISEEECPGHGLNLKSVTKSDVYGLLAMLGVSSHLMGGMERVWCEGGVQWVIGPTKEAGRS